MESKAKKIDWDAQGNAAPSVAKDYTFCVDKKKDDLMSFLAKKDLKHIPILYDSYGPGDLKRMLVFENKINQSVVFALHNWRKNGPDTIYGK